MSTDGNSAGISLRVDASASHAEARDRAAMSVAFGILLLVGVCGITFFAGLGSTALWEPDEPRFAEATRQMLLRRDFVTPWFNAQPRFEKPVLFYWLQLPFFAAWGPTEAAARAPSALAGLIAVLAVFGLTRGMVSTRAGVIAAVCLATTFRFVLYARQGLSDVPVVAAITCALWAMSRAVRAERGSPAAAWAAWAFAGAGILLKGPVALLAPIVWSLWAAATGGRRALMKTRPATGMAIMVAIAVPWNVAMWSLHGRAFVDLAWRYEVMARYLSPDFPGPDRGMFYFWGVWLGDALPWSLFLVAAFVWAYTSRRRLSSGEAQAMRLAAIWFFTVLILFSASQYKLPHYILPAYPAAALAVGVFADAAIDRRVVDVLWRTPACLAAVVLAAGAILVWLLISRVFEPEARDVTLLLPIVLAAGAATVGVLASPLGGTRPLATLSALSAILVVCYGALATAIAPRQLLRFQPAPTLAAAARLAVADYEPLAVAGGYRGSGLVFYARHPVQELTSQASLVAFLSGEGRRHCVLPASELERVRPLVKRPLHVQAEAPVFSVRMKRLLERNPQETVRALVLVTAE